MKKMKLIIPLVATLIGLILTSGTFATYCCGPWIDIKPGSCPNGVNPNSNGVIPVAIYGGTCCNVKEITNVKFISQSGVISSSVKYAYEGNTLILHFKTQDTGIKSGDTYAGISFVCKGRNYVLYDGLKTV